MNVSPTQRATFFKPLFATCVLELSPESKALNGIAGSKKWRFDISFIDVLKLIRLHRIFQTSYER